MNTENPYILILAIFCIIFSFFILKGNLILSLIFFVIIIIYLILKNKILEFFLNGNT